MKRIWIAGFILILSAFENAWCFDSDLPDSILEMDSVSSERVEFFLDRFDSITDEFVEEIAGRAKKKLDGFREEKARSRSAPNWADPQHQLASMMAFNRRLPLSLDRFKVARSAAYRAAFQLLGNQKKTMLGLPKELFAILASTLSVEGIRASVTQMYLGDSREFALRESLVAACKLAGFTTAAFCMGAKVWDWNQKEKIVQDVLLKQTSKFGIERIQASITSQIVFSQVLDPYQFQGSQFRENHKSEGNQDWVDQNRELSSAIWILNFPKLSLGQVQLAEQKIATALSHYRGLNLENVVSNAIRLSELYFLAWNLKDHNQSRRLIKNYHSIIQKLPKIDPTEFKTQLFDLGRNRLKEAGRDEEICARIYLRFLELSLN